MTDTGVKDLPDTEPVISSSATKFPPSILILLLIGSTSVILPSDDTLVTFSPTVSYTHLTLPTTPYE